MSLHQVRVANCRCAEVVKSSKAAVSRALQIRPRSYLGGMANPLLMIAPTAPVDRDVHCQNQGLQTGGTRTLEHRPGQSAILPT